MQCIICGESGTKTSLIQQGNCQTCLVPIHYQCQLEAQKYFGDACLICRKEQSSKEAPYYGDAITEFNIQWQPFFKQFD